MGWGSGFKGWGFLFFGILAAGAPLAHAGGEAGLYTRLMARFESPALQQVLRRAAVPDAVLGRSAERADDWQELARVLARSENEAAGQTLEWRLGRIVDEAHWHFSGARPGQGSKLVTQGRLDELVGALSGRALDELLGRMARGGGIAEFAAEHGFRRLNTYEDARAAFLAGGARETVGVALEDASRAIRIGAREKKALQEALVWKLSLEQYQAELRYLQEQLKVSEGELLWRLAQNRRTVRELVEHARGVRVPPGVNPYFAAAMDKIRFAVSDRRLSNPGFVRYVATMVAASLMITTVGEMGVRGDRFWDEFDQYLANLVTFALCEMVLTTVTHSTASSRFLAKRAQRGKIVEYARDVIHDAPFLAKAGFGLALLGNGAVEISKFVRDRGDPAAPEVEERLASVVWSSFLLSSFMATSGNFRAQLVSRAVAAVQRRSVPVVVETGLTGLLAWGNDLSGTVQYVFFTYWADASVRHLGERLGIAPGAPTEIRP